MPHSWRRRRAVSDAVDGFLVSHRILISTAPASGRKDFASSWGALGRVVQTPIQAPNANAYAERFVRSIREGRLDWLILFGERRLRRVLDEFVGHYQVAVRSRQ
jgi:putative transposase